MLAKDAPAFARAQPCSCRRPAVNQIPPLSEVATYERATRCMQIQQLAGLGSGQPSGALRSTDTAGGEQSRGMKPSGSKVDAARNALHDAFAKRGCDTLLRLSKKFKIMDDDNSGGLSYEEVR